MHPLEGVNSSALGWTRTDAADVQRVGLHAIVVFGGYMAGLSMLNPWTVILLASIGGTLGFMSMYAIGYRVGVGLLDENRFTWLPRRQILVVREKLKKRGFGLVAANRFLSGLRSVISLTVGMAHMSPAKTWFWSAVSSVVWCALLTWAGVIVGENWEVVSEYLKAWGGVVVAGIVVFTVIQILRYRRNRTSKRESTRAVIKDS